MSKVLTVSFYVLSFMIGGFVATCLSAPSLKAPTYKNGDIALQNYPTKHWGQKEIENYLALETKFHPIENKKELSKLLHRLCARYRFEPGLILSIMRVESKFQTNAVSPKGAIGLMQIMPDTGEWLSAKMSIPWRGARDLFNPEMNLRMGIYYLSYLRELFDGDLKKALVAYNRGPANVQELLDNGGDLILGYYHKVRRNVARLTFSAF